MVAFRSPPLHSAVRNCMQTLDRTVRLLNALAEARDGVGVTELARSLCEPASSTHRLLVGLTEHGFASQASDRRYRLGPRILTLVYGFTRQDRIVSVVMPHLRALSEATQESLYLSELVGEDVVCVASAESPRPLTFFMRVGARSPYHASSAARAILALEPEDTVARLLASETYTVYTNVTPTTPDAALVPVRQAAQRAYAACRGEMELGVSALSVPVCDGPRALASITIIAPSTRLEPATWPSAARSLDAHASAIEAELGLTAPPEVRAARASRQNSVRSA